MSLFFCALKSIKKGFQLLEILPEIFDNDLN